MHRPGGTRHLSKLRLGQGRYLIPIRPEFEQRPHFDPCPGVPGATRGLGCS